MNQLSPRNKLFRPQPPPIVAAALFNGNVADAVTDISYPETGSLEDQPPLGPPLSRPQPASAAGCADLVYVSDLPLRPTHWLWQDRLPIGGLSMISGLPGSAKTWVALAIAADLSCGRTPVTGEKVEPCTVLYASMEHDGARVVRPRFLSLGGDTGRLLILRGPFAPSSAALAVPLGLRHTPILGDALLRTQARLIILDSLQHHSGAGLNLDQPAQALPFLDELEQLADCHRCCVLILRHLAGPNPGRPLRARNSIQISAAFRTEFLAGASPDAPLQPALLHIKSNLGPLAPPIGYQIDHHGGFSWTGNSRLTRQDMLADRPTGAGTPKRKFAGEWLLQYLKDGPQPQYTIEVAAEQDGVCIKTLRRAKFDLGVRSAKDAINSPWYWSLPEAENRTPLEPEDGRNK